MAAHGGAARLVDGQQFTSWAFGQRAKASGLVPSMGGVGTCYDNAMIESLWTRMQVELLDHRGMEKSSFPAPRNQGQTSGHETSTPSSLDVPGWPLAAGARLVTSRGAWRMRSLTSSTVPTAATLNNRPRSS
jgi:transposase InsO family protein